MNSTFKFIILTFDLEEFSLPLDFGIKIESKKMLQLSYEGCKRLEKTLKEFDIKVTFFVTVKFASKFPQLIRKLAKEKHEIALHAIKYNLKSLLKEKKILENISRTKILGVRAHKLRLPSFSTLKKVGIKYDSSLHPTYLPKRYNNLAYPRKPFVINGVLEIPISVTPFLRLPFSFVWFRDFGLNYAKICTFIALKEQHFANLYFHPWEFINLRDYDLPFYVKMKTGVEMKKMLEKYLKWCISKGFKFTTIKNYIQSKSFKLVHSHIYSKW